MSLPTTTDVPLSSFAQSTPATEWSAFEERFPLVKFVRSQQRAGVVQLLSYDDTMKHSSTEDEFIAFSTYVLLLTLDLSPSLSLFLLFSLFFFFFFFFLQCSYTCVCVCSGWFGVRFSLSPSLSLHPLIAANTGLSHPLCASVHSVQDQVILPETVSRSAASICSDIASAASTVTTPYTSLSKCLAT
jgi:hypothetical protein